MHLKFRNNLLEWQKTVKRDLPWKKYNDAYTIWLSEVLLQQTRVEQAKPYFLKFKKEFETIDKLANASEQKVLKLWQGLGYYSRARNLHFTAKYIFEELNSKFPTKYEDILKLKGVGNYTAAAIASFAYNLPFAVLDGNVYRVLSRIFGYDNAIDTTESKKFFEQLAQKCLHKKQPATYNQAIMNFGAMQCKPKKPDCLNCVMNKFCIAHKKNIVAEIPFKQKKIKKKTRYFYYLVFNINDEQTILHKRTENDIWKNLYQFPLIETAAAINLLQLNKKIKENFKIANKEYKIEAKSKIYKHLLTHQNLMVQFLFIKLQIKIKQKKLYFEVNFNNLKNYAVPKVIENFITDAEIIKIKK